jgi:hypothetical protein
MRVEGKPTHHAWGSRREPSGFKRNRLRAPCDSFCGSCLNFPPGRTLQPAAVPSPAPEQAQASVIRGMTLARLQGSSRGYIVRAGRGEGLGQVVELELGDEHGVGVLVHGQGGQAEVPALFPMLGWHELD